MENTNETSSRTTVSPEVLITIARLTALSVPGVSNLAPVPGGVNRLFRRGIGEGVRIDTEDNVAFVDLYLIIKGETNIREVSRNVQGQIARALHEMVGMEVGHVNIHIEDIDYEDGEARPE